MQHLTPAPAASRVPAALLAVFALAPDPVVGAYAFAAAVAAEAPDAVMLADAGAPRVLALAQTVPATVPRTALAPHAVTLADADATITPHLLLAWGQGASAFNDLVVPLKSEWEEKRKESAH